MSAADRLAIVLQSPGLDLSGAEEAALVWLGRLLREPRSVTRDALGELHAAGRLVVRPSPLGAGLMAAPFVFAGDTPAMLVSLAAGAALIALSVRRGAIQAHYGNWDRVIA